jgi:hypothetical protein
LYATSGTTTIREISKIPQTRREFSSLQKGLAAIVERYTTQVHSLARCGFPFKVLFTKSDVLFFSHPDVVLHDITTILREQKYVDDKHDPPMLNFELWITLKNEAISALRFRDSLDGYGNPSDDPQRQALATEYLQAGLLRVRTEEDYHQGLLANSAKLRANEDSLRTGSVTR